MVMNLDKCIGCHTCSVTCKNTWTNRPGTEYMWYNNVETRPGPGYPKEWEDAGKYKGGWVLRGGKLALRAGGPIAKLANIFYNPNMADLDSFYEPWTYDYDNLLHSPKSKHLPVGRPVSLITGEYMDKPEWGRTGTMIWPAAAKSCRLIPMSKSCRSISPWNMKKRS